MRSGGSVDRRTVLGGLLMAVVSIVSLVFVTRAFLSWPAGQRIDETALRGARIGQSHVLESALSLLHLVSGLGLAAATLAITLLAFSRRRVDLAVGALAIVGGANVTTQLLKRELVERPYVGIDTYTVNSLPSGHTTVAVSLAVALVLVAPGSVRGLCAVLGAVAATLMGVATLAAGWHRPSDVVAGALVVGAWTGVVTAVLAWHRRGSESTASPAVAATVLLVGGGVASLLIAGWALVRTSRLDSIPTDRPALFTAYVGGSAGIGGTVALLLAGVLVVAHSAPVARSTRAIRSESSVSAKVGGV